MGTPDWEKELLRVARRVVEHGWGEVKMTVTLPPGKEVPQITISDTTTTRVEKGIPNATKEKV